MSCHYWWYCHNMDLYLQIDQAGVPAVTLRFQRLIPINADAHCYSVIELAISAAPSMCGITDIIMKMCVFVSCWIITFGFFLAEQSKDSQETCVTESVFMNNVSLKSGKIHESETEFTHAVHLVYYNIFMQFKIKRSSCLIHSWL